MASSFGGGFGGGMSNGGGGQPRPQMGAMINPQRRVSMSPRPLNPGMERPQVLPMNQGQSQGQPPLPQQHMGWGPGMGGPQTPRMAMAQGGGPPMGLPQQAQGNAYGLVGNSRPLDYGGRPPMGEQINPGRSLGYSSLGGPPPSLMGPDPGQQIMPPPPSRPPQLEDLSGGGLNGYSGAAPAPTQQYSMMGGGGMKTPYEPMGGSGQTSGPYSIAGTRAYDGGGNMNGESPLSEGANRTRQGSDRLGGAWG